MAYDYKEKSSRLLRKFERLEESYLKIKEENSNLRVEMSDLRNELAVVRAENQQLTKDISNLKIAGAFSSGNPEQRNKAKKTLAKILSDLDDCIAGLP